MSLPPRKVACTWSSAPIGRARATTKITLANLAYNMRRLMWIEGRTLPP
jgi:hypothetical protein